MSLSNHGSYQEGVCMQDSESNQEKYQTLKRIVSEISEMRHQLNEQDKVKVELEKELYQLKRTEEECRSAKASLEEQLANSSAEKKLLSEELEREIKERKRLEEEFRTVKLSLEEQLAKQASEMELMMGNLKNERETLKQALDNLQQQFNALYKL
jgi:chromosome segregation ATPase